MLSTIVLSLLAIWLSILIASNIIGMFMLNRFWKSFNAKIKEGV